MKLKLPEPEDYTEIEEYSLKLSKAYATIYRDAVLMLMKINHGLNTLKSGDEIDRAWAIKSLQETIDKFVIKEKAKS